MLTTHSPDNKTLPGTAEEGLVVIAIFERGRLALQSANPYGLGRKLLLAGIGLDGRAAPDVQARSRPPQSGKPLGDTAAT